MEIEENSKPQEQSELESTDLLCCSDCSCENSYQPCEACDNQPRFNHNEIYKYAKSIGFKTEYPL